MKPTETSSAVAVCIRVRRSEGENQDFLLEIDDSRTVLDALDRIRMDQDPSLVYRRSCHHGSCGTCACIIDGVEALACTTSIREALEGHRGRSARADSPKTAGAYPIITVEPLRAGDMLADIAVDPDAVLAAMPAEWSYLRPTGAPESSAPSQQMRFEDCIECGACVSACPVSDAFLGPAVLAAYSRAISTSSDLRGELLGRINSPEGVWGCQEAFECSRVCPTRVYPSRHIIELKRLLGGRPPT